MSDSAAPVEECPACGSEQVSCWEELETWICDECAYVVETATAGSSTPEFSGGIAENEDNTQDWKQAIPVKDKSEANLIEVVSQVEEVADGLGLLDELAIRAAEIAVEAWKANFMHGRTMSDTVGASVYAASRELERGIPPAFIADKIESDRQAIKSTYQQLKSELELDFGPPSSAEYLGHICQELNLPRHVEKTAEELLEGHHTGGNPVGIAAAASYEAAANEGVELTLRSVAEVIGLTKETIWRHTSKIREQNRELK